MWARLTWPASSTSWDSIIGWLAGVATWPGKQQGDRTCPSVCSKQKEYTAQQPEQLGTKGHGRCPAGTPPPAWQDGLGTGKASVPVLIPALPWAPGPPGAGKDVQVAGSQRAWRDAGKALSRLRSSIKFRVAPDSPLGPRSSCLCPSGIRLPGLPQLPGSPLLPQPLLWLPFLSPGWMGPVFSLDSGNA